VIENFLKNEGQVEVTPEEATSETDGPEESSVPAMEESGAAAEPSTWD
jgi:hypothetical protein